MRNHNVGNLRRLNVDQQRLASRWFVENLGQLMRENFVALAWLEAVLIVDSDNRQVRAVNFRNLLNLDDVWCHWIDVLMMELMLMRHLRIWIFINLLPWWIIVMMMVAMVLLVLIPERILIVIHPLRVWIVEVANLISNILRLWIICLVIDLHVMIIDLSLLSRRRLVQQIIALK